MEESKSKEALECGAAFTKETSAYGTQTRIPVNSSVKYDLVGKLVEETKLTRKDVIAILRGIKRLFLISLKIILKSSLSRQLHSLMRKRQQPLSSTLLMPFWISITV